MSGQLIFTILARYFLKIRCKVRWGKVRRGTIDRIFYSRMKRVNSNSSEKKKYNWFYSAQLPKVRKTIWHLRIFPSFFVISVLISTISSLFSLIVGESLEYCITLRLCFRRNSYYKFWILFVFFFYRCIVFSCSFTYFNNLFGMSERLRANNIDGLFYGICLPEAAYNVLK